jgi:hypothetical protein
MVRHMVGVRHMVRVRHIQKQTYLHCCVYTGMRCEDDVHEGSTLRTHSIRLMSVERGAHLMRSMLQARLLHKYHAQVLESRAKHSP